MKTLSDLTRGLEDIAEVGLTMRTERRGNADDHGVRVVELVKIGRGVEARTGAERREVILREMP